MEYFHSVTLDTEKCKGCISCVKRCPTGAIRVREGKASIISARCIDCGECIRVCPNRAKKAVCDPLSTLKDYKYTIALPPPSLYGQFDRMAEIDYVVSGLYAMGFDLVVEVAAAAEIISELTRKYMASPDVMLPVISSACPVVTRLIRARFASLCPHVLPMVAPVELAAIMARKAAVEKTGLDPKDIGVFFISPCPAKVTACKSPIGISEPVIDGVLSMSEVYFKLIPLMNKLDRPEYKSNTGILGISWAGSGGEASALLSEKYLAADGIDNVIKVLEGLENGQLADVEFIELNACPGGCVGGCLTVQNPFIVKARLQMLRKYLPVSKNHYRGSFDKDTYMWKKTLDYKPVLKLDPDPLKAMRILRNIESEYKALSGLDCGCCGAPGCRALAEDIVMGFAKDDDCIFKQQEKIHKLVGEIITLEKTTPPPFRKHKEENKHENKDEKV